MGVILKERQPCPQDGCNSSDGYFEYEDGTWCFACNRGTSKKPSISECEPTKVDFRGVKDDVGQSLGFSSFANPDNPKEVLYRRYNYGDRVKVRQVPTKKFWYEGEGHIPALGGTHLYNSGSSNAICVVEGEEDAAAFKTMCDLPVVWLTSAAIKQSERKFIFEYLSNFRKVILAFESDEAGKNAKELIGTMLAGKCFTAPLTKYKDASDYLQNNAEKEFYWAVVNAKLYTADFVFNSVENFRDILFDERTDFFVDTPFDCWSSKFPGLPLGHIVLIDGFEGIGKTEVLRALEYKILRDYPEIPISVTHHEESKADTIKGFVSYLTGKNTKHEDNKLTKEELLDHITELTKEGNLNITEIEDGLTVNEIIDRMSYLVNICGVKYFFIDPINQFSPPDNGDSITRFLDNLCQRVAKFCVKHNVCCVWTAHVNDDGQTRDSRMIAKSASIRISIDRDHMSEDLDTKNTTNTRIVKNRPYAKTGVGGDLIFDIESFTLSEKPTREIPF